jgi:predicted RNase H-like HicB family nuclease
MTTSAKKKNRLGIIICIEKDGPGYHAYCPKLKGLHVYGDTEDEAKINAKDAILAYLMSLVKHDEPIPAGLFHIDEEKDATSFCPHGESFVQELELVPA